jgi:hypothetical protein
MRYLRAAGGLAVAAFVCGLLFSGAAFARQAAGETISVSGIANGKSIKFTGTGSPLDHISFFGGSNWHFTAVKTSGGSCNLTPTNGGAFCDFTTSVSSFTVNTTISGPTPTAVAGQVGYADSSTGTFSALVTAALSRCHCTKLSVLIEDFRTEAAGRRFVFFLHWKLDCAIGSTEDCAGLILSTNLLSREVAHHGLHLILPPDSRTFTSNSGPRGESFEMHCGRAQRGCKSDVIRGNEEFALAGNARKRENLTLLWQPEIWCFDVPKSVRHKRTLKLKFNAEGGIDRHDSKLGAEVP